MCDCVYIYQPYITYTLTKSVSMYTQNRKFSNNQFSLKRNMDVIISQRSVNNQTRYST